MNSVVSQSLLVIFLVFVECNNATRRLLTKSKFMYKPQEKGTFGSTSKLFHWPTPNSQTSSALWKMFYGHLTETKQYSEPSAKKGKTLQQIRQELFLKQFDNTLQAMCKERITVANDGNCLFRAIAEQLDLKDIGNDTHSTIRHKTVDYMRRHEDKFGSFIEYGEGPGKYRNFGAYLNTMEKDEVWGTNLEVQAIAEIYQAPIWLYKPRQDGPTIIVDQSWNESIISRDPMEIAYVNDNHYDYIISE